MSDIYHVVRVENMLEEQTRVMKEIVAGQLQIVQLLEQIAHPPMVAHFNIESEERPEVISRTFAHFADPKLTRMEIIRGTTKSHGGGPRYRLEPETLEPWRLDVGPVTNKPSELVTIASKNKAVRTIELCAWDMWAEEHHCADSRWVIVAGRPSYCSECGANYPEAARHMYRGV